MAKEEKSLISPQLLLKVGGWRYPFFLVDRIVDFNPLVKGGPVVTIKNCSFNEPFIPGHFPGNPLVPGVLIAEMLGQTSEYSTLLCDFCRDYKIAKGVDLKKADDIAKALKTTEGSKIIMAARNNIFGFLAAQDLKFRHVVMPGDTIYLYSELIMADVNGFHHYKVEARVGRHVACSGKVVNYRNDREKARQSGLIIEETE